MRVAFIVMAAACALTGLWPTAARAYPKAWYPWCSRWVAGVDIDCSYVSHDQCMKTVSGVSGFCTQNPAPPPPGPPPRRARRAS
jgi:hypothetical protein